MAEPKIPRDALRLAEKATHPEAMILARDWAPKVKINGMTALEALALHQRGNDDPRH